jgi:acetylornithine deacetylase/succinyl-diaminopimelate desuccinylase-like protein
LRDRFLSLGLEEVQVDEIGNVLGIRRGTNPNAKFVAVTAHVDTVFPAGTPVEVRREGGKLYGPGVSDNAAGVAALLGLAGSMKAANITTEAPLLFVGNVGEEGEGDVRGMRHLFATPRWRDSIAYTLVLDGAGTDTIITEALGSKRFLVTVRGPGGHSWSDFGLPNPIMVLSRALETFRRTPIPSSPKTTFNVGVISGGTSVNSIPESVSMRVDIRSVAADQVDRLERSLRDALEQAVRDESPYVGGRRSGALTYEIKQIGSRPAARLKQDSRIHHAHAGGSDGISAVRLRFRLHFQYARIHDSH